MSIPIWTGMAERASQYDAWLCDIWGVLHNGVAVFPGVAQACARYRAGGGRILLVSNAPRPAAVVAAQLEKLGITAASYDSILTSGDVTTDMLRLFARGDELARDLQQVAGERGRTRAFLHIGPARDLGLFDGLDISLVEEAAATQIVCSGLFDDTTETPATYRAQFERLVARGLSMICANPDITVERGGQIIYCAGALAKLYAELGGAVVYAGKPHAGVYRAAFERLSDIVGRPIAQKRVLAIGDGVFTDIKGAATAGIDSLYIPSPIYMTEAFTADSVARLFAPQAFKPTAAMAALTW